MVVRIIRGDEMVAKIGGTVFIKKGVMTIEPQEAFEEFGIDPDAVANLITALQRNIPDGQYFFDLTLAVDRIEE